MAARLSSGWHRSFHPTLGMAIRDGAAAVISEGWPLGQKAACALLLALPPNGAWRVRTRVVV
jgi:hypothetical protein